MNVFTPYGRAGWRTMALLMRSNADPASLAGPAREAIRRIDPAFATYDVMTMLERRRYTHWSERFLGRTFSAFALAALLLACLGAYGLAAYSVAQRRIEIGVRIALGAGRLDVIRLLLARGALLAAIGLAAGAPLAVAAAKIVEGMLFEISPWRSAVWIAAPAVLALAVLLASWIPAQRASRADPVEALRHE
jgi:ABC-type antimicrobial peptide transport system permease subunit